MIKDELIRKVTSRKFLALVSAIIITVTTLCKTDAGTTQAIISIIASVSACVAYIYVEGQVDIANTIDKDKD
jgi:hypothetical protein